MGHDVVDLLDKGAHLWDELNKTLWNQDHTVVLAKLGTTANDVSDLVNNLGQGLLELLDLLTNQHAVDLGSEGALERDMGC